MNDTLKVAGRIGAELGAAKAENEKLRGLLRGAHDTIRNLAEDLDEEEFQATIDQLAEIELALAPKQAEPECRCTLRERTVGDGCSVCNPELAAELAADIEDDEPAPAQDEHALFEAWWDGRGLPEAMKAPFFMVWKARAALAVRAAQTEQQPVVLEGWRAGVEAVAAMIEKKADDYAAEFGHIDMGALSFGIGHRADIKRDHHSSLVELAEEVRTMLAAPIAQAAPQGKFRMGDLVKKSTGSEWEGRVVGWYSTEQTKEGYAVESSAHRNSVQIYPVKALEAVE